MNAVSGAVRLLLVLLVIALGAVACGFAGVLSRSQFFRLVTLWHKIMLKCLGVGGRYRRAELAGGTLLISNHISWIDIMVFGAHWPVTFLANSEITRWPVLGWVFKRVGTLFIERGTGAKKAITEISAALKQGRNVILFPEGITTDGRSIIRFQPRLMQAAIDADAPLQPAAIRYFDTAGKRVAHQSFAGEITLLQSAWKTVSGPRIIAEVTLFEPLAHDEKRQVLASRAEDLIRAVVESDGASQ